MTKLASSTTLMPNYMLKRPLRLAGRSKVSQQLISLHQEEVKSEYLRSLLLIILFSAILVMATVNTAFFVDKRFLESYGGENLLHTPMLLIVFFIIYQLSNLVYLRRRLKRQGGVSFWYKMVHTLIEISFPTTIMFYLMNVSRTISVVDSPVAYVYPLFIILSILHLDYRVNIFAGILAGIQYSTVSFYGFEYLHPSDMYANLLPSNSHYIRSLFFVFTGGAGAFVSLELSKRIRAALDLLEARNRLELLFGQQVSREISQALIKEKGATKKLEATIMFLDVRNFTPFADAHTAEEVFEYQNNFLSPIIEIINYHQGVVFQILGDGLMACFGSPVENVLHADMAFQASLTILDQVKKAADQMHVQATSIGIGLHAGPIVTGNIGNDHRKQFSISGSPVIIASRIEQLNKKYGTQFLISGQVLEQITVGRTQIAHLGREPLRGIGSPVDIYEIKRGSVTS